MPLYRRYWFGFVDPFWPLHSSVISYSYILTTLSGFLLYGFSSLRIWSKRSSYTPLDSWPLQRWVVIYNHRISVSSRRLIRWAFKLIKASVWCDKFTIPFVWALKFQRWRRWRSAKPHRGKTTSAGTHQTGLVILFWGAILIFSHRCSRLFLSLCRSCHRSWGHDLHLTYRPSLILIRIDILRIAHYCARTHRVGISNQNRPTTSHFREGFQAHLIVLLRVALSMHNHSYPSDRLVCPLIADHTREEEVRMSQDLSPRLMLSWLNQWDLHISKVTRIFLMLPSLTWGTAPCKIRLCLRLHPSTIAATAVKDSIGPAVWR